VEASHHLILLGSTLVLLSIFAGVFSARLGAPLLVVFLGLGMLAGEEGLGGIVFRDFHAAYLIGGISLAIILFDGGLRTDPGAIRRALWPSLALATLGVIAMAAIVGAAAVLLFSTSWIRGLLIGAIIAPTDAAAVSALLHLRGLELRARVAGTLELESGINDPISVLLTVLLVNLLLAPTPLTGPYIATLLAREVVGGAVFGIGGGYLLLALINRLEATSGLYPILALAGATALFGGAQTASASGFLAVYLAGLIRCSDLRLSLRRRSCWSRGQSRWRCACYPFDTPPARSPSSPGSACEGPFQSSSRSFRFSPGWRMERSFSGLRSLRF
jgi:cell volume regulation protein A